MHPYRCSLRTLWRAFCVARRGAGQRRKHPIFSEIERKIIREDGASNCHQGILAVMLYAALKEIPDKELKPLVPSVAFDHFVEYNRREALRERWVKMGNKLPRIRVRR